MTINDGKSAGPTKTKLEERLFYKAFRLPDWKDVGIESRVDIDLVCLEVMAWAASLAAPEFHLDREEPEAGDTYDVPRRFYKRLREYLPSAIVTAIEKDWYDGDEDMPSQVSVPYKVTVHKTTQRFRNCPHLNKEQRKHVKFLTNGEEAKHG